MGAATLIFFLLPWLDRAVKSIRYRGPKYRLWFTLSIISFLLRYLGVEPTTVQFQGLAIVGGDYIALCPRVLTVVYFLFFALMPWYTAHDKEKPEPSRLTW